MAEKSQLDGASMLLKLTKREETVALVLAFEAWEAQGGVDLRGPSITLGHRTALSLLSDRVPPEESWPWQCLTCGASSPVEWCSARKKHSTRDNRNMVRKVQK